LPLNEGGIRADELGPNGPVSLTVAGETIQLFDRRQDGPFYGLGNPSNFVFNMLESPGGPISDQVLVFGACQGSLVPPCDIVVGSGGARVVFMSDPNDFYLGPADATIIEDGTTQHVGDFLNNNGNSVHIFVLSDAPEAVPEPTSLALLGAGLAAFSVVRRRKRAYAAM
jgi:hypothetical protein